MNSKRCAPHLPSVGLGSLDKQHRHLLHLIARIGDCLEDAGGGVRMLQMSGEARRFLANDLFESSLEHFRCEEDLLAPLNYPLLEAHRNEHREFIGRLTQFLSAGIPGVTDLAGLHGYAADWMGRHKLGLDMEYAKFLCWNRI